MDLFDPKTSIFPVSYSEIIQRVRNIEPRKYGSSRNYLNGAVTYISPYISRGVISTKFVLSETLKRGYQPAHIEKFIQELTWRDYWQQVWRSKGDLINQDIKHQQTPISNRGIPQVVLEANTGIEAIDQAIKSFYSTGYMHNHVRMYIASIICNISQSYWKMPAQWMYFHLLDADWASNALSWQWVAGANSNKKYVANQENINRYCFTDQNKTFLDVAYEGLTSMPIPELLKEITNVELKTVLPKQEKITLNSQQPTIVYNAYNLDPYWHKELGVNRVLLLEPSHFKQYPISTKTIDFIIDIAKKNIPTINVYIGEYHELVKDYSLKKIYFKEHPLNRHYQGIEEPRDWLFNVEGEFTSFFAYWKKCKKEFYR